jgi:hypothetical protein
MNEITTTNATTVLQELEKAFWDIPFDNSKFQTEMFVIAASITPERAYRTIGLQMFSKLNALREALYQVEMSKIDMDEYQAQIDDPKTNEFERRRAQLKLHSKQQGGVFAGKLLNDVLVELNHLYANLKKFPQYTGEQFEAAERVHYEQRLLREATGMNGATTSLVNMREDFEAMTKYQEQVSALPSPTTEQLLQLLSTMPNKIRETPNE